jgi:putative oxygen-independent coproporphyrinogen III oxidase
MTFRLQALLDLPSGVGIYLHIPFCASICPYCNFTRGLVDDVLKGRYVSALEQEIRAVGTGGADADSIYFGGGTPSLLDPAEVRRLIQACRATFNVAASAEVTLEANPETVTAKTLAGYREAGVNRLSLGVQSFRDEELKRLGRLHDAETSRRAVEKARQAGFDNISLDLMLWLPQQTTAQLMESVDALVEIAPEHASLYLLELYPNAPLREVMVREGWSLAPDEDAASMYLGAMERLEGTGYRQYEISNVSRPGRWSRHNLKYWTGGEWVGFGCGAHSTRGGIRWKNVAATEGYIGRLESGVGPVADSRPLSRAERLEEALFMGLRLADGVNLGLVGARHGVDVWARYASRLAPYVEAGLLVCEAGRLRLTRRGMLLANEVMSAFVEADSTVK